MIFFVILHRLKRIKNIISGIVWTLVMVYLAIIVLTHIAPVQSFIAAKVSDALQEKFNTKVCIGKVNLGFLNRIIIDDVLIYDQHQERMLAASRISAKFDYIPLAQGRIVISSTQLFGLDANLYKETKDSKANYQFLLDSLASKDTTQHTPLDLSIRSLVIRRGNVAYRQRDISSEPGRFSLADIKLKGISTHIILDCLRDDSINLNVKSLSVTDKSGLAIDKIKFHFIANNKEARLTDFSLRLPHSLLQLGPVKITYSRRDKKIEMPTLQFSCQVMPSELTPADLAPLLPQLQSFVKPILLSASFYGTSTSVNISNLSLTSSSKDLLLYCQGSVSNLGSTPRWAAQIRHFNLSSTGMQFIAENLGKNFNVPPFVTRLGNIHYIGNLGGYGRDFASKGIIRTDAGTANVAIGVRRNSFTGRVETNGLNLKQILNNNRFGILATHINVDGKIPQGKKINLSNLDILAQGSVQRFDYNGYSYRNLTVDGTLRHNAVNGTFTINDPNISAQIKGKANLAQKSPSANIVASISHFNPSALQISNAYPNTVFSFYLKADVTGRTLATSKGSLDVKDFNMRSSQNAYSLSSLHLQAYTINGINKLEMQSDFGQLQVSGHYNYATLPQAIINFVGSKLPTLPGLKWNKEHYNNQFNFEAHITKSDWLNHLFKIPLQLETPVNLSGQVNELEKRIEANCSLPAFSYSGKNFENGILHITTPNDTVKMDAQVSMVNPTGRKTNLELFANAADNKLLTTLKFNNNAATKLQGAITAQSQFFKNENRENAAHINILPSEILVGDTIWQVEPAYLVYSKNRLSVSHLSLAHNTQHLSISGTATPDSKDSLTVDFQGVDVAYILDLVNFTAVSFGGQASGRGYVAGVFGKPSFHAQVSVDNFLFSDGRMGLLDATVAWNQTKEQIDINAVANDTLHLPGYDDNVTRRQTEIYGWVAPKRNDIQLNIVAHNTRGEFLEKFCSSFLDDTHISTNGKVTLIGPLNQLNLVGQLVANGDAKLTPINCRYQLCNDTIVAEPNKIQMLGDTLRDNEGGYGILRGVISHKNLSHLAYNFNIDAHQLHVYNWDGKDGSSFYGSVYGSGKCSIEGGSGNVDIDINITPHKNSEVVYDASSPYSIANNDFIHWTSRDSDSLQTAQVATATSPMLFDIPSDVHINFLIHTNPEAALRVIMDKTSGDYILLRGNGTLRATYYNKGAFNIFGNYVVEEGVYKLTIQNIIHRLFTFSPGGTIVFGGDPYAAQLNLNAGYTVNGVSLADLNIGRSFASNNIRVNCLMNITGTPASPQVSFSMDMPSVGTDAKQMIMSIINSDEEMNQQVLYLLAVGRFYSQGVNNAATENIQQNQTSLAMQSILSGQISQQINNILGSVVNNSNWNFGANISTGDEGWNNAEYEGLVSGKMFNNRLLFNGQFGYRDNANANASFIGDFDLRYLLKPNGNFALRVYNQTSDRYFTRNSLNTQGVGIILKKDFNGLKDLLGIKSKKNKNKKKSSKNTYKRPK